MINGGLHEDLDLTNNSMRRIRFQLEIALRCDFADIFEVKSIQHRTPRSDYDRLVANRAKASYELP